MTNTAGEPIIGATVLEKGNTTNGTITDIDGNFTINLPANATLSISYIGYITQEIQVGYQTSFKVVLKDDTKTLDEIIVVGYGSQKKANLTGAVSSVKMDEALGDRPLLNPRSLLIRCQKLGRNVWKHNQTTRIDRQCGRGYRHD